MQKADDLKNKIENEEDFIASPSHKNSVKVFVSKHPDGAEFDKIAKVLMITEKEAEEIFASAVMKLRESMNKGDNSD